MDDFQKHLIVALRQNTRATNRIAKWVIVWFATSVAFSILGGLASLVLQ